MIEKWYDKMLHTCTRHTNLTQPYSDYVKGDKYPEQYTSLLNTYVYIKYRNHYKTDFFFDNNHKSIGRPSDDTALERKYVADRPEDIDDTIISEEEFLVLRADKTEPYILIGVSKDYSKIIVNSTRISDESGDLDYLHIISSYPMQLNEFLGVQCQDHYVGEIPRILSIVIRCDEGEPCYTVLAELLGDNKVRFVLGDESQAIMDSFNDLVIDHNLEGGNANIDSEIDPNLFIDIDGVDARPDWQLRAPRVDLDGGHAYIWTKKFDDDIFINDSNLSNLIYKVLEGRTIYGSV